MTNNNPVNNNRHNPAGTLPVKKKPSDVKIKANGKTDRTRDKTSGNHENGSR